MKQDDNAELQQGSKVIFIVVDSTCTCEVEGLFAFLLRDLNFSILVR